MQYNYKEKGNYINEKIILLDFIKKMFEFGFVMWFTFVI